jgi:hypothetical protein
LWAGESISSATRLDGRVSWLVLSLTGPRRLGAIPSPRPSARHLHARRRRPRRPHPARPAWVEFSAAPTTIVAFLVLGSQIQIWHLVAVGGVRDGRRLPAINTPATARAARCQQPPTP